MKFTYNVFGKVSKPYKTYAICSRMAKRYAESKLKNIMFACEPIRIYRDGLLFGFFIYIHKKYD